ncbi:MAG: hypothetical protein RQ867_03305 [Mariprofundaceae bacterium]|nr:hypothetical protein [Mariprofundaceae bacterium]
MNTRPLSFSSLRTVPILERKADTDERDFGAPYSAGGTVADLLCSLPNLGAGADLFRLRDAIVSAHHHGRKIIVGCGGHVMDTGLSPLLARLIEQRLVSGVVLTGEALLQDVEIALVGQTLRYRDQDLINGRYCMTEETGRLINDAVNMGAVENWGFGTSIGRKLLDLEPEHLEHSVVATACRYGIPVTVHPTIGADVFTMHPQAHGESLGSAAMYDFRLLAGVMAEASGGVVLNVASGVVLPRLFLQAVDAARNLGKKVEGLTTAVIDPSASASSVADVVGRLSRPGGEGYCLSGPDEILLPLLFAAVIDALGDDID